MILKKLEATELKIERQPDDIRTYIEQQELDSETSKLLMAQQKATKTSIEILRDEIEELHQVVKLIFNEIEKQYEMQRLGLQNVQNYK